MASQHPGAPQQGPLQNGQIFNNQYEIVDVVGSGGHAFVYRGRHRFLQHFVAIKVIHRASGVSLEMLKRAQAEAQIEFRLKERGIVTVYDAGINDDGLLYIIMELLRGCSGREALDQHGKLNVREVLRMAKSIATTLQVAHSAGIVHRDLKPENLFFTVEDVTKVLDFGVAKIDEVAGWKTRENSSLGTFVYMSPEQALGYIVTNRSDIYTLGLIMFEMLVGTHPVVFQLGERPMSMHALSRIIVHEPLPDLHRIDSSIPSYVAKLVTQATEKNPADRFGSMTELVKAVQACEDLLDEEDRRLGRRPIIRDLSRKVPGSSGVSASTGAGESKPEFGVLPSVRAPLTPRAELVPAPQQSPRVQPAPALPQSSERPTVYAGVGAGKTAPLQESPPRLVAAPEPQPHAPSISVPPSSVKPAPASQPKPSPDPRAAAAPVQAVSVRSPRAVTPAEPKPEVPMQGPDLVRLLWGLAAGILIFGAAAAFIRWRASATVRPAVEATASPIVVPSSTAQRPLPPPPPSEPESSQPQAPIEPPQAAEPGSSPTATPAPAAAAPSVTPHGAVTAKPRAVSKSGDVTQSDISKMEQRLRTMGIDPNETPRSAGPRSTPSPAEPAKPARNTVF